MDDAVPRLRKIPLFAELDDEALDRVAQCAKKAEFRAGTVMIERGQPGSGLFVIVDGTARAHLHDREVDFAAGDFIGELSLLTDAPRAARVVAVTDARVLAISRSDFRDLLESDPRIALTMLRVVAARLVRMLDHPQ